MGKDKSRSGPRHFCANAKFGFKFAAKVLTMRVARGAVNFHCCTFERRNRVCVRVSHFNSMRKNTFFLGSMLLLTGCAARAQNPVPETPRPVLNPIFSDNAVLQRDRMVPVWGQAAPGHALTIKVAQKQWKTQAGADGRWTTQIGPFPATNSTTLEIEDTTNKTKISRRNIAFGDVWICSGQSNMQFPLDNLWTAKDEKAAANFPQIRLLQVPQIASDAPLSEIGGPKWQVCSPQTIGGFSAVGYFFGRKLNQDLKVPIGLVNSSWGGTVAEAWTSASALEKMADFQTPVEELEKTKIGRAPFEARMQEWWQKSDAGSRDNFQNPATDDSGWKTLTLPGLWDAQNGLENFDGIGWYRREIEIPAAWAGKDLTLNLGAIDDRDTTFWNGQQVGETEGHTEARHYVVPGALVKAGKNVIAVRLLDTGFGGGFSGQPAELTLQNGAQTLVINGEWKFWQGAALNTLSPAPSRYGVSNSNPNIVTVLYNGMIAPLAPYGIKGAIWYQGESNAGRANQYQTLLPTMINDWRARFNSGDFPFYIVQLADFMQPDENPDNTNQGGNWAWVREAQTKTAQDVKNSGLVVTTDIGDRRDIHPNNKGDVGKRLALLALEKTYNQKLEASGPIFTKFEVKGREMVLYFDKAEGLNFKGEDANRVFVLAGEDKKFHWATARVEGETVVLNAPQVEIPVAARFAWSSAPRANLFNQSGLPANSFRTDRW